jgi:NADH-quinone oxidoreductase subunit J
VGYSFDSTSSSLLTEQTILFWTLAALTGISAIAVVVTQNIVRAATWLLFALGGTAGIYFLIGADFIGAVQLIVYVGGILVLVVFGVMLTAQGPFVTMRAGAAEWVVALCVGILLFSVLAYTTGRVVWFQGQLSEAAQKDMNQRMRDPTASMSSARLGLAFLGFKEISPKGDIPGVPTKPGDPGSRHKMAYLLPFEIVSVHLLVVLIAAAYLARAKRRRRSA